MIAPRDRFFGSRNLKSNKTLPRKLPGRVFENLRSETLVVGAARSRCGNPHNSSRHHGNRTRCRTGCGTTSRTRTSRLRERVARECCKEERRYQLFHETPKEGTTSLMVHSTLAHPFKPLQYQISRR
jgi:hypothetical protein